jgi:putative tricarboxylic transport membrane protein
MSVGPEPVVAEARSVAIRLQNQVVQTWSMRRSSNIGVHPGVGTTVSSTVAYMVAKNVSKTPEEFGSVSTEAIPAAAIAKGATTGGLPIPRRHQRFPAA